MNEIFWLAVSFILILLFTYKPVKRVLNNIIDSHITNTKELLNRAEKAHDDSVQYLQKLEKDLKFQDKLNKEKLAQNEHLLNSIKLENDKKIEEEIKRQFIIAEMQRKTDEEVIVQEIASKFLLKNINNVVSEFSTKDAKNSEFLKQSLDKLNQIKTGIK
jgi:F0F1-type ATP synthase membrane subunit b/b'